MMFPPPFPLVDAQAIAAKVCPDWNVDWAMAETDDDEVGLFWVLSFDGETAPPMAVVPFTLVCPDDVDTPEIFKSAMVALAASGLEFGLAIETA